MTSRWLPPTLDFPPVVLTARSRDDADALAASNGRDLVQERVTAIARVFVWFVLLGILARYLLS